MKKYLDSKNSDPLGRPASTEDLLSRQSVRATFRLSAGSIQAINIIVTQLGIKPKSLFDHLLEDTESIRQYGPELLHYTPAFPDRIQKTFVISKKSLSYLDQTARRYQASRDVLVENLVRRLLPVIREEKKKHRIRKKVMEKIAAHFQSGEQLLDELGQTLGNNDQLYSNMLAVMSGYDRALSKMADTIEKGSIVEEFTPNAIADLLTDFENSAD